MSDCCLTPKEQFFRFYIMVRTSYIRGNSEGVRFVLNPHP